MGWSIGFDKTWNRDIGYGVPAYCDHPGCVVTIDRGLGYVCGGEPCGGRHGCGLYFCEEHHKYGAGKYPLCERCADGKLSFDGKPEHADWIHFKETDESWAEWRKENPQAVRLMKLELDTFVA